MAIMALERQTEIALVELTTRLRSPWRSFVSRVWRHVSSVR
jgi:hypothetical protein